MFVRAIAIALCLGSVTLPAVAVTPAQAPVEMAKAMTTEELMQATALDKIFDTYAETIAASPETQGTPLPAPFLSAWKDSAFEVFKADMLHGELARSLDGKLSDPELRELATFFHSDFGRRITEIEGAVPQLSADEQLAAVDEGNAVLDTLTPDATRVRQIDEMLALISAEISRSMVGVAMRAMMVSMAVSGATGDIEVPWEEIDAQLEMILPGVEAEVLASQRALMAYAYQELSDAELETYVEFLRTAVSQKFYAIVGYGVGSVMENAMSRFGEQLARRLNQVNV
jgi:hypothetical protein